jgi:hypothetical protein
MRPFADPVARRHLQRLVIISHLRDPQVLEQLLTDVASAIGGGPAILAALEQLAAQNRGRRAIRGAPR